jgi:hypothetical protein
MRRILGATAVLAVVLAASFVTADAAVAAPPSVANGYIVGSARANPYNLYWDTCSGDGKYMYLETLASTCGDHGWGAVWGYAYVSSDSRTVAVCHSNDHSATTTMHYAVAFVPGFSLSDSAGGSCQVRSVFAPVTSFYVTWGDARSPTIPT